MISSRSKDEVIAFLQSEIKNEAEKDTSDKEDLANEYREFIINRIGIIT